MLKQNKAIFFFFALSILIGVVFLNNVPQAETQALPSCTDYCRSKGYCPPEPGSSPCVATLYDTTDPGMYDPRDGMTPWCSTREASGLNWCAYDNVYEGTGVCDSGTMPDPSVWEVWCVLHESCGGDTECVTDCPNRTCSASCSVTECEARVPGFEQYSTQSATCASCGVSTPDLVGTFSTNQCGGGGCFCCADIPVGSEICDNGTDDDEDGFTDCFDSDCADLCLCETSCTSGDACCPSGCVPGTDSDCAPPPPTVQCELTGLNSPLACVRGNTFDIIYQFRTTDHTQSPYVTRLIEKRGSSWHTELCIEEEEVFNSNWHTDVITIDCGDSWIEFRDANPNIEISCGTYAGPSASCVGFTSGMLIPHDVLTAYVRPIEYNHIRVQGPGGIIKLKLKSTDNADSDDAVRVKVIGGWVLAADLVPTSDPSASAVRVMTPSGIRAWAELP